MAKLEIHHTTTYRYSTPVQFGEHQVMYRPRAAHDIRVASSILTLNGPFSARTISDVFSNSVTYFQPLIPMDTMIVQCTSVIEHLESQAIDLPVEPRAQRFPISYTDDERFDLSPFMTPHAPDLDNAIAPWAAEFIHQSQGDTKILLTEMSRRIQSDFEYQRRDTEGTQTPAETLAKRQGTCRDFAYLMIEALRRLGFACRFVSGYLYDPALDRGVEAASLVQGAGTTHAWLNVYLPGAGWSTFDPTNASWAEIDLIKVAIGRHPGQSIPLRGSWIGRRSDYLGMSVDVKIQRIAD